jgi:hypothetical protein
LYFTVSYTTNKTDRSISVGVLGLLHPKLPGMDTSGTSISLHFACFLAAFHAVSIAGCLGGGSAGFALWREACVFSNVAGLGKWLDSDGCMKGEIMYRFTYVMQLTRDESLQAFANHRDFIMAP